jgi:hypothetical protein
VASKSHKQNKNRITYLDISNRDLVGSADLKDFTNLKSLNSYSNKIENLDFLNSLPNEKLERLTFYGNNLKEVDLATLLKKFPNLKALNIENNPVKAVNLQNLTNSQIDRLVKNIQERKFKLNSYKGTVLIDLLFYIQGLISKGDDSQTQNAYYLQKLTSGTTISQERNSKEPTNRVPLIAVGVSISLFLLLLGYYWGKREKEVLDDE